MAVDPDSDWQVASVQGRWTRAWGTRRTGLIAAQVNARAWQRMMVWVTPAGQLTRPPNTSANLRDWEAVAARLVPANLAVLLIAAGGAVRMLANRRRLAGWAQAWAVSGPQWPSRF